MDELYKYLFQQTSQQQQVSQIMVYLQDEEYDTDAVMEDISGLNTKDGDENSNVYRLENDKHIYKHIQKYLYYQKRMKVVHMILLSYMKCDSYP